MKTRNHNWFDPKDETVLYGVQVFIKGTWHHAMRNGLPILCTDEATRDKVRAEIRKQPTPGKVQT